MMLLHRNGDSNMTFHNETLRSHNAMLHSHNATILYNLIIPPFPKSHTLINLIYMCIMYVFDNASNNPASTQSLVTNSQPLEWRFT